MLVIVWSSVNLVLDEPRNDTCGLLPANDSGNCRSLVRYLAVADTAITVYFLLEMVVEMLARGLVSGPRAYFKDAWRLLDFAIVAVSVASLASANAEVKALRSFRVARALRPLRLASRHPGLRLVIDSIFASFGRLKDIGAVLLAVMFVFGVFGMQSFRGSLLVCNDPSVTMVADCVGTFMVTDTACAMMPNDAAEVACRSSPSGAPMPRLLSSQQPSYDSIGDAMLATFSLVTGENW